QRHGIVDRRADAADGAVAFEAVQALVFGFADELLFEVFAGGAEGDVHQRADGGLGMAAIKAAGGDGHVVERHGRLFVAGVHIWRSAADGAVSRTGMRTRAKCHGSLAPSEIARLAAFRESSNSGIWLRV